MAQTDRSYMGKGTIFLKRRGGSTGLIPVGNCSALELSFEEEKKEQKDYTSPGGGNTNVVSRIDNVTGSLTVLDITADNLALGLRGAVTTEAGGNTVTDELIAATGADGELLPCAFVPDTATIVVTDALNSTALAEGVDYDITPNGITVIGTGAINSNGVHVTYDKAPQEILQALVEAGQEFTLFFDGLNEAQSGKAVAITLHRIKFSPVQGLPFIGDEFAEATMEFEVLSDNTITGAGISRFMKVVQAV